jgi:hypothetical protein
MTSGTPVSGSLPLTTRYRPGPVKRGLLREVVLSGAGGYSHRVPAGCWDQVDMVMLVAARIGDECDRGPVRDPGHFPYRPAGEERQLPGGAATGRLDSRVVRAGCIAHLGDHRPVRGHRQRSPQPLSRHELLLVSHCPLRKRKRLASRGAGRRYGHSTPFACVELTKVNHTTFP